MFNEPYSIIRLESHIDPRGYLFEILRFKDGNIPANGYIYCFAVNPGQTRGGHYHTKKKEWFSCVSGEATVLVEDQDGSKEKIILNTINPVVVYCGPYISHTFYNETQSPAVIVSYGSKQHNSEDQDTFRKK